MLTTTKPYHSYSKSGYSTQDAHLRIKCPDCDKKRTGPCLHPSIFNPKGNTK